MANGISTPAASMSAISLLDALELNVSNHASTINNVPVAAADNTISLDLRSPNTPVITIAIISATSRPTQVTSQLCDRCLTGRT